MSPGLAASIQARLLNRAKSRGEDFNLILTHYALERFLYRLSLLPARESYWLKGAMLFDLWFDVPHRPTRDADFLGFGAMDIEVLGNTIREICSVEADDGMVFDPDSIAIEEIREDARYGGLRVRLLGKLGNTRCTVQLDVGYRRAPPFRRGTFGVGTAKGDAVNVFSAFGSHFAAEIGQRQLISSECLCLADAAVEENRPRPL